VRLTASNNRSVTAPVARGQDTPDSDLRKRQGALRFVWDRVGLLRHLGVAAAEHPDGRRAAGGATAATESAVARAKRRRKVTPLLGARKLARC